MAIRDREAYNKYHREWSRQKYKTDPIYRAKIRKEGKARYDRLGKNWKSNSPEAKRACKLKNTFGLTEEQYEQKLKAQDGKCAICGRFPGVRKLAVDHNHTTGQIRSLLCTGCNLVAGWFENNPNRLMLVQEYIKRWL